MESTRTDNRGHWPKGKLRSGYDAKRVEMAVAVLKRTIKQRGTPLSSWAKVFGVHVRTLQKWLNGQRRPNAQAMRIIETSYVNVQPLEPVTRSRSKYRSSDHRENTRETRGGTRSGQGH